MKQYTIYNSPIGKLYLIHDTSHLYSLSVSKPIDVSEEKIESSLSIEIKKQLNEYFTGTRKTFDLPLQMEGTPFQQKVWKALCTIPYGETRSYQDIAIQVGCPKGPRAIGLANNKNPIMIIVPCHRVIGKNGKLVGFACGIEMKDTLLKLEKDNR